MYRAARFVIPLLVVLGFLTWAMTLVVGRMSRTWFERDVATRAQLAAVGSRRTLVADWNRSDAVRRVLDEMAQHGKLLGAAACSTQLKPVALTSGYPARVDCETVGIQLGGTSALETLSATGFSAVTKLTTSDVYSTAIPIRDDDGDTLGFVILVEDLSVVDRREALTQRIYGLGFGSLALLASLATLLVARASWRSFREGLRGLVRGDDARRPEFAPLLGDVRELVARMAAEHENGSGERATAWNPERLKQTLTKHLHGERIVIVSNREPYIHTLEKDGSISVSRPASGLVTALEPVMRACSGVWIAHGSGTGDRQVSDARGRVLVPPAEKLYTLRHVWISPEEEQGYYYGFSNEGLWPLCHVAHTRPVFRGDDFAHYQRANERFADAVVDEVDTDDPIVLVQDYHFALAPRLIRDRLPRATIITFWHIPWPNAERFGICPWEKELLQGMLGSSILGFHTQQHCNNFLEAVDRFLEARIDRELNGVIHQGHLTLIRPYPISIEWPSQWLASAPPVAECRRLVLEEHKLAPDTMIGVGVDRIDYTKGLEERFLAVERMLEKRPDLRGRFVFLQLGAPSRTKLGRYRDLNDEIERLANRINARFTAGGPDAGPNSKEGYRAIILHRDNHDQPTVFRYYRAADLCYVSSLHDGMNLVAKEFVAARDDERGVLLLSSFTGAARELTEALIVNPYDLDEASLALAAALEMSPAEQQDRMAAMRAMVAEWNIYRWAGKMLVDASKLRQRDRLSGRLAEGVGVGRARPSIAPRVIS